MTLTSVKLTDKNIRGDINNLQEKILVGKENLHKTDDYLDKAASDNLEKFGNCETVKQVKETYQSLKTIEVEEYKTKVKGLKAELTEIKEKVANSDVSFLLCIHPCGVYTGGNHRVAPLHTIN